MAVVQGVCKEVLEKTEWIAIVTGDTGSPHLSATWGDYVRKIGIVDADTIVIPAGHYSKTEENLKKNRVVQLLVASKDVKGTNSPGQGCIITGEGEIQTEGRLALLAKEKFSWARGALVIKVRKFEALL